jgi:hypothetical protein
VRQTRATPGDYRPGLVNVPQLRVLGVGEMLDVALKIYWRNGWTLFRLVFLIVAPVSVLTALVTWQMRPAPAQASAGVSSPISST